MKKLKWNWTCICSWWVGELVVMVVVRAIFNSFINFDETKCKKEKKILLFSFWEEIDAKWETISYTIDASMYNNKGGLLF